MYHMGGIPVVTSRYQVASHTNKHPEIAAEASSSSESYLSYIYAMNAGLGCRDLQEGRALAFLIHLQKRL